MSCDQEKVKFVDDLQKYQIKGRYPDISNISNLALFSFKFVENPHKNMELIQCARRLIQMQLYLYTLADYYEHPFVEEIKKHAIEFKY